MTKGATVPKLLVYLLMFLLLEPILRLAGVVASGLYLALLAGLGIALLVRRTDRRRSGPQYGYPGYVTTAGGVSGYVHTPWPYGPPAPWPAEYVTPGYAPADPPAYAPNVAPSAPLRPRVQPAPTAAVVADPRGGDPVAALWLDDPSAPHWIRENR